MGLRSGTVSGDVSFGPLPTGAGRMIANSGPRVTWKCTLVPELVILGCDVAGCRASSEDLKDFPGIYSPAAVLQRWM